MDTVHDVLYALLIAWAAVTAALICLLIYRGTLASHEDDQIFLDTASSTLANEQRAIVARIDKLSRPINALIVLSSLLLVVSAGLWLWQGFKNF
ncbi:MAG TPA: hypothetical protein VEF54_01035 [archaeon]|nr:hypothetical protein [archaeon]